MPKQIDACNAIMIFGVHGWSFQSSSLIKSWVQNRVSTKPLHILEMYVLKKVVVNIKYNLNLF